MGVVFSDSIYSEEDWCMSNPRSAVALGRSVDNARPKLTNSIERSVKALALKPRVIYSIQTTFIQEDAKY